MDQFGARNEAPMVGPTSSMSLPWTGERYVPELGGTIALEHLHRYATARELVAGKLVLDLACGEGYGSWSLSESAQKVLGVDVDADVIRHAKEKYQRGNLDFVVGSCAQIPCGDQSIDVVVSFETIEHVREHDAMMKEIKRVLRPDGLLFISSPEQDAFSALSSEPNPFHVKELSRGEFRNLLAAWFKHAAFFGQRVTYGSSIFSEDGICPVVSYAWTGRELISNRGLFRPQFLMAVASDVPLPLVSSGVFEPVDPCSDRPPVWPSMTAERIQREQAEADLAAVLHSTSWRITSPLRSASALINKLGVFMRATVHRIKW
jgi:ubiquinone/menaquinone biosynthesis C-methylase UbiE